MLELRDTVHFCSHRRERRQTVCSDTCALIGMELVTELARAPVGDRSSVHDTAEELHAGPSGRGQEVLLFEQEANRKCGWLTWPTQIYFIMGNEVCERFSFYGMRAILVVYMTDKLLMSASNAESVFHLFTAACYLLPLFGAWLADTLLGRYLVVLYLSFFYCLGHAALAVWENKVGLFIGLALVSFGAGGIKPCVAAMVGDQFDQSNKHQLPGVFAMFYWCINLGSFTAMAVIPVVMGGSVFWAFSIPGIVMAIALAVFWAGRRLYILVEPQKASERPAGFFIVIGHALQNAFRPHHSQGFWGPSMEKFSAEEVDAAQAVCSLLQLFACLAMYSALFDQHSSTWVVQAQQMDRSVFGWEMPAAQMQALNPVLVMALIPTFEVVIYPALTSAGFMLTPLRKMGAGMLLTGLSFAVIACIQGLTAARKAQVQTRALKMSLEQVVLDAGRRPSVLWQVPAYLILTSSEVLVSTTGLQFAYTQAPNTMKSTIMSLWLLTVFLGNVLDAVITKINVLSGTVFFVFFVCLMLVVAMMFIWFATQYKMRDYSPTSVVQRSKCSDRSSVDVEDSHRLLSSPERSVSRHQDLPLGKETTPR